MTALAALFPVVVFFAVIVLALLAFRLGRQVSRGSRNAGPFDPVEPDPVGLQQTPWELTTIHDQLMAPITARGRIDLVNTMNRLTKAAGETDPQFLLASNATNQQIAWVVDQLERRLELAPPGAPGYGGQPTHPVGSSTQ